MRIDKQKLKLAQAKALMTNEELASAAKISVNTLTNVYKGNVQAVTAGKIAHALNVDVEELLQSQ